MAKAKDAATVKDADLFLVNEAAEADAESEASRDAKASKKFAAEESVKDENAADFKDAQAQAEADFQAQAEASARAVPAETLSPANLDEGLDWDFVTNDAGQVVEPEVLAIQERQKEELAERERNANAERKAQDQGPRTELNHPSDE